MIITNPHKAGEKQDDIKDLSGVFHFDINQVVLLTVVGEIMSTQRRRLFY